MIEAKSYYFKSNKKAITRVSNSIQQPISIMQTKLLIISTNATLISQNENKQLIK